MHLIGNYEIITLPAGENIRKAPLGAFRYLYRYICINNERLVVTNKEYARNLLEISMNHLQSRSFRLRVSLKKIMQCATII